VVFVALVVSPNSRAGDAYAYRYDGPLVPGTEARDFKVVASGPTQLGDAAEVSTSARVEALGTSTTFLSRNNATEAGYTASKINISEEGLNKVFQTHLADGPLSAGKSLFNDNVTITRLIADADSVTPLVQSGSGNLQYIVDAGRVIGIDRATGQATSIYTVVTKSGGDLVTAVPGTP
jgi:hypothetical protein